MFSVEPKREGLSHLLECATIAATVALENRDDLRLRERMTTAQVDELSRRLCEQAWSDGVRGECPLMPMHPDDAHWRSVRFETRGDLLVLADVLSLLATALRDDEVLTWGQGASHE